MKVKQYGLYAFIGINYIGLLYATWMRWGDFIIDTFRDQWVFNQLARGDILYKDVLYMYGFLPPYIGAFFNKLLGPNILWSVLIGIFVTAFTLGAVYRIARIFLNRVFTTLICLSFLYIFAFSGWWGGLGIFNFILPYSLASTFFLMFTLYALYFLLKFIQKDRKAYLLLWTICVLFSFLSRMEFSIASWTVFSAILLAHFVKQKRVREIVFTLYPLIAAAGSYALFLWATDSLENFINYNLKYIIFASRKSSFSFQLAGFDELFLRLSEANVSFAVLILILAVFYLLSYLASWVSEKFNRAENVYWLHILTASLSAYVSIEFIDFAGLHQFISAPVMLVASIIGLSIAYFFLRSIDCKQYYLLMSVFILSFVMLWRILLKASPLNYGFFLLVPSLICYHIFSAELAFKCLSKFFPIREKLRGFYLTCVAVFFSICTLYLAWNNLIYYRYRDFPLDLFGKGTIYCLPDSRFKNFNKTAVYLKKKMSLHDTLVVFPEGIGLNYMLNKENPTKLHTYIPDLLEMVGEGNLIRELEHTAIDYLVIMDRATTEYGAAKFGVDYGNAIMEWIKDNYELIKTVGPSPIGPGKFGTAVFKRKKFKTISVRGGNENA